MTNKLTIRELEELAREEWGLGDLITGSGIHYGDRLDPRAYAYIEGEDGIAIVEAFGEDADEALRNLRDKILEE